MASEKQLIWLDCDPGHDDFFALLLAAMHPNTELIGVSTVGGNQTVDKVTLNALNALNICGFGHIPCVRGQEHALMAKTVACPEIHGDSGLDLHGGASFPSHSLQPYPRHWLQFTAESIMNAPRRVTLIATGRLTNIALLLQAFPQVMRNIDHISIMGGAMRGGNTHPVAEFNIQGDPEAAQIVFNAGSTHGSIHQLPASDLSTLRDDALSVPVILIPLEVTHTVIVNDDTLTLLEKACNDSFQFNPVESVESKISRLCNFFPIARALFMFFSQSYKTTFGFMEGPPLHDPVAVYFSICPEEFQYTHWRVDVECVGTHSRGQTVVDIWKQTGREANVHVATKVNVPAFWQTMEEMFKLASKRCILNLN